jgi:putative sigma-54 modulation protein
LGPEGTAKKTGGLGYLVLRSLPGLNWKLGGAMTQKQKTHAQSYGITITGRHVHVTDAMKAYALEKIAKLERIAPRIIDVNVIMDIQKLDNRVDIVLQYANTLIKSHGSSTDMYASIDMAVHKLEAQLRRYLSRIHDHFAKGHAETQLLERVYQADLEEINEEIEMENQRVAAAAFGSRKILGTDKQQLEILTDDEAIMKMDLSRATVLIFRGEADRKLRVIYRREDGNYGIIEAE